MRSLLLLAICLFTHAGQGQNRVNTALKKELDSILTVDQKYREFFYLIRDAAKRDSLAAAFNVDKSMLPGYIIKKMHEVDSSNLLRMKKIIQQYGYPGKSLVGEPANEAAFYVIQHSPEIETYLPMIKAAAEKNELPFRLYAMMHDRSLMRAGKEQIYGTQGMGFETTDPKTGKKEFRNIIWPILDPVNVNERRKKAGFSDTVEENANRLQIVYEVLTLEQVRKMRQQ